MNIEADAHDDGVWDFWDRNKEFYDAVLKYYRDNPDPDIVCHEGDGAADSKSEAEAQI